MNLDKNGHCCGRRPLRYKRPYPHQFCCRCDSEYDPDGNRIPNWAWEQNADGKWSRKTPRPSAVLEHLVED